MNTKKQFPFWSFVFFKKKTKQPCRSTENNVYIKYNWDWERFSIALSFVTESKNAGPKFLATAEGTWAPSDWKTNESGLWRVLMWRGTGCFCSGSAFLQVWQALRLMRGQGLPKSETRKAWMITAMGAFGSRNPEKYQAQVLILLTIKCLLKLTIGKTQTADRKNNHQFIDHNCW